MTHITIFESLLKANKMVYHYEAMLTNDNKNIKNIEKWVITNKIQYYKSMIETLRQAEKL